MGFHHRRVSRSTLAARKHWWCLIGLFLVVLSIAGCTTTGQEQPLVAPESTVILAEGHTFGQTFVAHHAGLLGLDIWLAPQTAGSGNLTLILQPGPRDSTPLATATLPLAQVTEAGWYHFAFAPLPDSHNRDYYAQLTLNGSGQVAVGGAAGESYLHGARYIDGQPEDAQISFRLVFDSTQQWLDVLTRSVVVWLPLILMAALLYLVPGWALLVWLWPTARRPGWPTTLGLAAGLSLALHALLLLWTDLVGVHLGSLYVWLPSVLGLLALVWWYQLWQVRQRLADAWNWLQAQPRWADLALLLLLAMTFAIRLLIVGSLDVPLWGDSYHHAMITQLLVHHGGMFDSWQPYAELTTFTYHFGFHTAAAGLQWLSGMAAPQATLWTGQLLNGLAVLALCPLAVRLGGNRWAAVVAVLLAGLIIPMPLMYVTWGRYTQLAGQVILPAVLCLTWLFFERRTLDWRMLVLTCLVWAGLALTHYRVLVFAVPFVAVLWAFELRPARIKTLITSGLALALGTALLVLPWYLGLIAGRLVTIVSRIMVASSNPTNRNAEVLNAAVPDPLLYLPVLVWLLLPIAIGWGLWRRQRDVAIVGLWWFLVIVMVNPHWLGLPGAALLTNFTMLIAFYLPAAVLLGAAASWLIAPLRQRWLMPLLVVALLLAGSWGTTQLISRLDLTSSMLATRPDVRASRWIAEHTPADAHFLVNAFFPPLVPAMAGSDGGWWLPLLAQRSTTLPPYTYGTEQGPTPDYKEQVEYLTQEILTKGIDHPDVQQLLHQRGVTHAYIGQRQGLVNTTIPLLQPSVLLQSPYFDLVYHEDRVFLFALRDSPSGAETAVKERTLWPR
ncbi:MAG: hypothetical protein HC837_04370 [Chloroflexaceae bacterium]|nr:hypothetical protein [Chloroflexaceae bacterium]